MITNTIFTSDHLLPVLQNAYGLTLVNMQSLLAGMVGFSYIVASDQEACYFLKILGGSRLARISQARLDFSLALVKELYDNKLFTNLSCPLPNLSGGLYTSYLGYSLILFNYLPYKRLEKSYPPTPEIQAQVARLLAKLHSCTPAIKIACPYVENFELPFEETLLYCLTDLEHLPSTATSGQQALRDLLYPHQQAITAQLQRLKDFARLIGAQNRSLVYCHTDPVWENLLMSDDGELYLVDWDGVMLAPPEHDLFLHTGENFPAFRRVYERCFSSARLSAEAFAFYFYRRNLEDLTDWLYRILYENTSPEQDQIDLQGIQGDCDLSGDAIAARVQEIKKQLASTYRPFFS